MKIEFEYTHEGMTFRDAIVLPSNHNLTAAQIEAIKQKRIQDWLASIAPQETE